MNNIHYTLQFFDYWHTGSGLSGGTYADLIVNKTKAGLPLVPGKTIKGLLRHAAEDLLEYEDTAISQEIIDQLFGASAEKRRGERQELKQGEIPPNKRRDLGQAWFGNAELPSNVAKQIDKERANHLYEVLASTAIDAKTGTAQDHSLRQIEVTIPLTLTGQIANVSDAHRPALERCLRYVKRLGHNRSRGLGRCQFKIID